MPRTVDGRLDRRVKKRLTYLLARTGLGTTAIAGVAIMFCFALLTVGSLGGAVASLVFAGYLNNSLPLCIGLTILFGFLSYAGFWIFKTATTKSDEIPYVPPIHDKTDLLP